MNDSDTLEQRLESLGAELRTCPRLADRVMDAVRASGTARPLPALPAFRWRSLTQRRWSVLTATAATISLSLLLAIILLPRSSTGWEDVAKAVQRQKWMRATIATPDGKQSWMWLSTERQVWAFQSADSSQFSDGRQRAKYEYHPGNKRILKLPLGEEDARRIFPVDDLSQGKTSLSPWFGGTEKIVSQSRREVIEAGKTWIEFQLVFWRGDTSPATLRVDPETRLPVYLLHASPGAATKSVKMNFDYPEDGPADIYALGAPANMQIEDRVPSDECLRVFDAIAASRARLGNFRLLVAQYTGYPSYLVYRKGERWRVDQCWPEQGCNPLDKPAHEQNWGQWFAERLKLCRQVPLYICDGRTVYQCSETLPPGAKPVTWQHARSVAPQDLLSGEGLHYLPQATYVKIVSLLYPDLSPKPGWTFEFDPHPAGVPACVLVRRSAQLATREPQVGHEWYYLDPAKGYAVVRAELFNLPAHVRADPEVGPERQTIRLEDFHQSPQGFWYPSLVYDSSPLLAGPNTGAGENVARVGIPHPPASAGPQSNTPKNVRQIESTVRYHFDFAADLPDSLFVAADLETPQK